MNALDLIDWTMTCCPHCGWHWHSVSLLARHLEVCHGISSNLALLHAHAIRDCNTRLKRTLERNDAQPATAKDQVSKVARPHPIAS